MPIIGLTAGLTNEMPRVGQLRKGAPKPKGSKQPGPDLTYFRFICNDPRIAARFDEVYRQDGKEPRIVNCHLAFPDLERAFPTWNEEHGAGSLKHRCDSQTMILWQDESGLYHTEPKPCPYADYPKGDLRRKCKQHGLLRVIVDELGEWGYVEVITGGKWDCIGLTQNVLEVEEAARRASMLTGRPIGIQGIPCQLKREPRMTSCPPLDSKGPRVRLEKWMLYLYVHPEFNQALMREMSRYSLPMAYAPQIAAPADLEVDYYVANGEEDPEIEHPETEVVDGPEPVEQPEPPVPPANDNPVGQNGKQQPQAGLPVTAPDLLAYVNQHVLVTYDNLVQLREALAAEGLPGKNWPDAKRDLTWWQRAKEAAIKHAESKAA